MPQPAKTDEAARPDNRQLLFQPSISINGRIGDQTLPFFLDRLQALKAGNGDLILELNTYGGDADVARRIALEIRLFAKYSGRRIFCVGKTTVYSAGITILAAFPQAARFLTEDAILLIHERRVEQQIVLNGPMQSNVQIVREKLSEFETACRLEEEGFRQLAEGSRISADDIYARAVGNCYLTAGEALELGLVAEILS